MKEELLKSVAQPMQVFYAPFKLFILNVIISVVFMVFLIWFGYGVYSWFPVILFIFLHLVSILIGKKEPHIDSILSSRRNIRAHTKNLLKENGNKFTA